MALLAAGGGIDLAVVALLLDIVVVEQEWFLNGHNVCSVVDDIFHDGVHSVLGSTAVVDQDSRFLHRQRRQ